MKERHTTLIFREKFSERLSCCRGGNVAERRNGCWGFAGFANALAKISCLFRIFLIGCFGSASGFAQDNTVQKVHDVGSAFKERVIKFASKAGEKGKLVRWDFVNQWDLPMMIERIDVSCGCLLGTKNEDMIKPGKKGHVEASFDPGPFRGKLQKSIHVRFVGFDKPVELSIEAMIASTVETSTRDLFWPPKSELLPQTIDLTAGTGIPFEVTGLTGISEEFFVIKKETVKEKFHYRLTITPLSIDPPAIHCLQVRTDSKDLRDGILPVFLHSGHSPKKKPVEGVIAQPLSQKPQP